MCGIVGGVSSKPIVEQLMNSLERLEYRGYDSAGVAVINAQGQLKRKRCVGGVNVLRQALQDEELGGCVGVAHTRWATHGKPSVTNAHPHLSHNTLALVHNGIIDNYATLAQTLVAKGVALESDTDSECVAHLLHDLLNEQGMRKALVALHGMLQGSYALGVVHRQNPESLWAVTHNSPLVIGIAADGHYLASDQLALIGVATHFIYLKSGEMAELRQDGLTLYSAKGEVIEPNIQTLNVDWAQAELGSHRHYMHKELFEQPRILGLLQQAYLQESRLIQVLPASWQRIESVQLVACGSSYYAALLGQKALETHARIPCRVTIASEYRYQEPLVGSNCLFVSISQSGETADTLAALRLAKTLPYCATMTVCNVASSALVRESDHHLATLAGTEVGVASTKAFTAQVLCLQALALAFAYGRGQAWVNEHVSQWAGIEHAMASVLALEPSIEALAHMLSNYDKALYIGRDWAYPVMLEGALKLKEISYIHAQAYPAGELKHGPLALVDSHMPVVACLPESPLLGKALSNCETVAARDGQLMLVVGHAVALPDSLMKAPLIRLPSLPEPLQPLAMTVVMQLLAYHTALFKGFDVDKPRNLAKSVTVE